MVTNGATLKWGWVYVAARAAYPVMVRVVLTGRSSASQ